MKTKLIDATCLFDLSEKINTSKEKIINIHYIEYIEIVNKYRALVESEEE